MKLASVLSNKRGIKKGLKRCLKCFFFYSLNQRFSSIRMTEHITQPQFSSTGYWRYCSLTKHVNATEIALSVYDPLYNNKPLSYVVIYSSWGKQMCLFRQNSSNVTNSVVKELFHCDHLLEYFSTIFLSVMSPKYIRGN